MKPILISFLLLYGTSELLHAQTTPIPDANFEQALIDLGIDSDSTLNGEVLTDDINTLTDLNVFNKAIEDLTGIEDFDSLQSLNCSNNRLATIDLSQNIVLVDLNCSSNLLNSLDVSNNPSLGILNCQNNLLTALDVAANTMLKTLDFTQNQLSNINTSANDSLVSLKTSNNRLMTLDVANNLQLTELFCSSNQLSSLVVTNNDSLTTLLCASNQITSLNLSANDSLVIVDCSENQLTSLDVSNNSILESLTVAANQLNNLDVSQNDSLTFLGCSNNQLQSLEVSNSILLENLICASNQLTQLDVRANFTLRTLDFSNNLIISANLSENDSLSSLDASNNQLQYLNIQNGNNGELASFNALNNPQLTCITVDDENQIGDSWLKDPMATYSQNCNPILTFVPDNNFEQALIDLGLDTGPLDSLVVTDSINALTVLDVSGQSIAELTGIQDFTALESLDCSNNQITTLDLISNTALTSVDCSANNLVSMIIKNNNNVNLVDFDATNNPGLTCIAVDDATQIGAGWLKDAAASYADNCNSGQTFVPDDNFEQALIASGLDSLLDNYVVTDSIDSLRVLDVSNSNIFDLRGIEDFVLLDTLDCSENNLSALDINQLTSLKRLTCFSNYLPSLDVTANDSLTSLNCGDNRLTTMDVSQNTLLEELIFDSNFLSAIDISANDSLLVLNGNSNSLTNLGLDLSTALQLEVLFASNNNLTILDLSQNDQLIKLECADNYLETLDLTANVSLRSLDCSLNLLSTLDLSSNILLDTINCNSNQLTNLAFLTNPQLQFVSADDNQLAGINVNNNLLLSTLLVSSNELTTLNVSNNTALNTLLCDENQLDILDVTNNLLLLGLSCKNNLLNNLNTDQNVALLSLSCDDNQINSLDLSNNPALIELSCNNNQLDSLNTSVNTALESLLCNDNLLTGLDVSTNSSLSVLSFSDNQIDIINTTTNIALTSLECDENQLTGLNLDNNLLLSNLSCSGNEIADLNLNVHAQLISLNSSSNQLITLSVNNGNNDSLNTFNAINNPQLTCIEIDDVNTIGEFWQKDEGASYSEDCHYLDTFVPDDNFEAALAAITGVPDDNDDYIPTSSIEGLSSLDVSSENITELTGIQDFVALQTLDISNNSIDSLNLSDNSALVNLDVSNNLLDVLELNNNTLLEVLDISSNQLTSFNTDSLSSLVSFIGDFNTLVALDFRNNGALTTLSCVSNQLTSLRANNGNNSNLSTFDATGNLDLLCIEIDDESAVGTSWLKDATASYSENCHYNETFVPDDAFEQALIDLGFDYSSAGPLDDYLPTSRIRSLTALSVSNEGISDLTGLQDFAALISINCSFNQLTELDISLNSNLEIVNCSGNQLANLDISANAALTNLNVLSNQLTSLDITLNVNLTEVLAQANQLFTVDANNGNNQNLLVFDLRDNPNLTCILVDDIAASQGYPQWFKDAGAAYKLECNDDDNDGVVDEEDDCPATPFGEPVDLFGCPIFNLPVDNFSILTTGETCTTSDNGNINISAVETFDYTATLIGDQETRVRNFTNTLEMRNIRAGIYELCITIQGIHDYEQCYRLVITQPEDLEVISIGGIDGGHIGYHMSGGLNYLVDFNGLVFETNQDTIFLSLEKGKNTIRIKTEADCQGMFEEIIYLSDEIMFYPNPFENNLNINLGGYQTELIQLKVFSSSGVLVRSNFHQAQKGLLNIDTSTLASGVYYLKLVGQNTYSTFKIVKR